MSLRNFWNFRNFANFWNLKWQFWQMTKIIVNFFSWFFSRIMFLIFWYSLKVIGWVFAKVPKMDKWALTGEIEKFFKNLRSNLKSTKKITPGYKFLCLYVAFQILPIFEIFEISNGHFGQMAQIFENFFLWFLLSIIFAKFWSGLRVLGCVIKKVQKMDEWAPTG